MRVDEADSRVDATAGWLSGAAPVRQASARRGVRVPRSPAASPPATTLDP